RRREVYLAAVRDWVTHGASSRHALPPDAVRTRLPALDPARARAAAFFRLGTALHHRGRQAEAQHALAAARALHPESLNYLRPSPRIPKAGPTSGSRSTGTSRERRAGPRSGRRWTPSAIAATTRTRSSDELGRSAARRSRGPGTGDRPRPRVRRQRTQLRPASA